MRVARIMMLLLVFAASAAFAEVPAAWKQSGLDLMPWPAHIAFHTGRLPLTSGFDIAVTGDPGDRTYAAATRLLAHLEHRTGIGFNQRAVTRAPAGGIATLVIDVRRPGVLKTGEDESYQLVVDSTHAVITAEDDFGAMHGLQTFLQLVQSDARGFYLPAVDIQDQPRFAWRGLMIDVARHFEPVNVIERNIRGMAAVKMNVLHLHLSDNQGFRLESKVFPELTGLGSDGQYFTQAEMKDIIAYAADRGIIVVPEFDVPAHSQSWFVSHPELASAPGPYRLETGFGVTNPVFDPTNPETYRFLGRFFKEIAGLFPGDYIHIGGDENNGLDWDNNPFIQAYMQPAITSNAALQTEFIQKVARMINADGKEVIGWDEILQPGLPKGAIIQSWRGKDSLYQAAREGHRAILSNGYYLDLLFHASQYYLNDPIPPGTELDPAVRKNILGGEAEMWSELVRPGTIDSRIWPSAAAIAERLWSPQDLRDVPWMYQRLQVENRRLAALGLTQISGQQALLHQLAAGDNVEPLKELVDVISPLRGYQRMASGDYTVHSPLDSLADAATGNPWTAIAFNEAVDRFIKGPDAAAKGEIRAQFERWLKNDPALEALIEASPALQPAQPLAQSLAALSRIGLRALTYIDAGKPAPREWAWQTTTQFLQARKPAIATKLRVVDAIEKLVVLAVKGERVAIPTPAGNGSTAAAQRKGTVEALAGAAGDRRLAAVSVKEYR